MSDDEIQLIEDGEGVAVIGRPDLVDRFLRSEGLESQKLDLVRLQPVVARMSGAVQAAGVVSENSGRWLKMNEKSAGLVRKYGASLSKESGLMTGVVRADKGKIVEHLKFVPTAGASLLNPAVLSSAGGIMAQMAMEQQMAEINDYLQRIDEKLDDVARALKDSVLADLVGVKYTIEEAMEIRDQTGHVSAVTWSKIQGNATIIARAQDYAVRQLEAFTEKLDSEGKVGQTAKVAQEIAQTTREWLVVLAQAFKLQDALGVLELERVMDEDPENLDSHRVGLRVARDKRLDSIATAVARLLERVHSVAELNNRTVVFNWKASSELVDASNRMTGEIVQFQDALELERAGEAGVGTVAWRSALLGMRDEALEAGAQSVETVRRASDKARTSFEEGRDRRLDKRIEKLSRKRAERGHRGEPDNELESR